MKAIVIQTDCMVFGSMASISTGSTFRASRAHRLQGSLVPTIAKKPRGMPPALGIPPSIPTEVPSTAVDSAVARLAGGLLSLRLRRRRP
jgi:hypothetical protein